MAFGGARSSRPVLALLPFLLSGLYCFAQSQFSRYERSVVAPATVTQACAVLDAQVFPHSAPYLKDLRLISVATGNRAVEIPYVITLSEPVEQDTESAQVANAEVSGHTLSFDLKMPSRPYSDVDIGLAGKNFIATATVTGRDSGTVAPLGEFTLFDLTAQHLGRSTTLHLAEAHYGTLHVALQIAASEGASSLSLTPSMIVGATVPPSREAQSLFTTVAETSNVTQEGNSSVAHFVLPQRVPVERISIVLAQGFIGNFSRTVRIEDRRSGDPASAGETIVGTIQRVRLEQADHHIDQQELSIVTTLGANLQGPADVQIAIENRDLQPLPITSIRLEMRERKLCFDARMTPHGATLFYGDPALSVARNAYAPVYVAGEEVAVARMGREVPNPAYHSRPSETLPLERRQQLLWAGMLLIVSTTAMAVFFSSKRTS
jgi:hypothetical protein